jgi:hypothetical protein
LRLLNRVDGQRANGIDAKLVELRLIYHGFTPTPYLSLHSSD